MMGRERDEGEPEGVAANRRGLITDEQRRAALELNWSSVGVAVVVALVAGALLLPLATALMAEVMRGAVAVGALVVALPVVALAGLMVWRWHLVRRDLATGEISSAEGEVRWRRHRYAAEFPDRPRWASNTVTGLAPGAYRFYYLPRSGQVLSAEALPAMRLADEVSPLDQALRQVHGFGAGDLEANREGRLGARQAGRMLLAAGGLGVVTAVVAGAVALSVWGIAREAAGSLAGLAVGFLGLVAAGLLGWTTLRLALDAASGRVEEAEGRVTRSFQAAGRSMRYYYHIEGRRLDVSYREYQALVPGRAYRVYYTPRSRRVVGVEATDR
jgi:YD repeat-containing protein